MSRVNLAHSNDANSTGVQSCGSTMFPNTEAPRKLHQSIESLVEEMNSLQQLIITSASTPDQEINCPFQKVECFCELLLAPILQGEVQQLILSLISFSCQTNP